MPLFKSRKSPEAEPPQASSSVDTLVGRHTEVYGDLRFAGGLHVDGTVKGRVTTTDSTGTLSVAPSGAIEGDVNVPHVVLAGRVQGDVRAMRKLTLRRDARITGNVYYRVIEIEAGALINGQCVFEGEAAADGPAEKPVDELTRIRRLKSLMS